MELKIFKKNVSNGVQCCLDTSVIPNIQKKAIDIGLQQLKGLVTMKELSFSADQIIRAKCTLPVRSLGMQDFKAHIYLIKRSKILQFK